MIGAERASGSAGMEGLRRRFLSDGEARSALLHVLHGLHGSRPRAYRGTVSGPLTEDWDAVLTHARFII